MMRRLIHFIIVSAVIVVVLAGCVRSVDPRPIETGATPDPTATPAPLNFSDSEMSPPEEVNHDSRLEWWYHSGHLKTEEGREFGFHFVLFKSDASNTHENADLNFVAQLGLLDVETGEYFELSRTQAGVNSVGDWPMALGIADWAYGVSPRVGSHYFSAQSEDVSLSLNFEATTPVMLHNDIGWLPTEAGASYYYSWPRQDAVGELTLNGETFEVAGTAWFDHQWGDFFVLGKPAGWQWFAIQLEDGGSLMLTESRGLDGKVAQTYGTYMSPGGEVRSLQGDVDGIELAVTGEWTSSVTGATYPSGWAVVIESLELDLIVNPVVNDQEVRGGLPLASTYWEGKARVGGRQRGEQISGDAYVELSGYVDPQVVEWMQRGR
jgi:predicted secreted hydrolase